MLAPTILLVTTLLDIIKADFSSREMSALLRWSQSELLVGDYFVEVVAWRSFGGYFRRFLLFMFALFVWLVCLG